MIIPLSFLGKKVLITGAGRGLGLHLVKAVLQNQGEVVAVSKTKEKLDDLKSAFPQVTTICVDLMDWDATRRAIEPLEPVDILVNNAGMNIPGYVMKISPSDFEKTFSCNVLAQLNMSQMIAEKMIQAKKSGSIVTISSVTEKRLVDRQGLYGMSKMTLGLMTRLLAMELGPHNIRVNNICPGLFPSDMSKPALENPKSRMRHSLESQTPLGRIGTLDEVANATMFFMSDASSYITGQSLLVDGGFSAL